MGFEVQEIVRLAVGPLARCDDRRANARRAESYGLELRCSCARSADGQLPMRVCRSGRSSPRRAWKRRRAWFPRDDGFPGTGDRPTRRQALCTRCDDRRANAGRESVRPRARCSRSAETTDRQLPMQVVGPARSSPAQDLIRRRAWFHLETMGFQVQEIVRLAVGLVPRCDDRRANAGRESVRGLG